jgi:tRNA dimethylallyltransferase
MAGPTASGKTSLAVGLAKMVGGVVINADSMQVYDCLNILSARPTEEEMGGIPHWLFGMIKPDQDFSVDDWHTWAMVAADKIWTTGKTPLFVGGTGLYFRALLEGLAEVPAIPDEIRKSVRSDLARDSSVALHKRLVEFGDEMAGKLEPGDGQRVARALEVRLSTGCSLAHFQANTAPGGLASLDKEGNVLKLVLELPRDDLYARIDDRFHGMVDNGAVDEVRALQKAGYDPGLMAMKALGVPSLLKYLDGEMGLDQAMDEARMHTRRYAKRQTTWFKNRLADWRKINMSSPPDLRDILSCWLEA